jgi:hypothetical protein
MNATSHDPFDQPDAEDEADTRERVLEGGEDAGDGDARRVREELGLDEPDTDWTPGPAQSMTSESVARIEQAGLHRTESAQPGFDEYEWDSTWASIEESAGDDPNAALSQYADLVERMLAATGHALDDPVASTGEPPEVVRSYLAARETAERAELGDASRADVETAIEDLRSIFDAVLSELGS